MKRALVLSLAVLFGLGVAAFAQTLSGEWDTTVSIQPTPVEISLTSTLEVTYALSGWSFTSYSELDETGWLDQTFDVSGALGAFTLGSFLDLDPAGLFDEWIVTAGVSIAGVTFGLDWDLAAPGYNSDIPAGGLAVTLSGSGTAGLVTIGVDVYFGDVTTAACDLDWTGVDITVDFPFCCADVESTISFTCDGFVEACFDVDGIAIPNLPWITIGAELCFELQTKTLTLTPTFNFGEIACFSLYIDQDYTGNLLFGDIHIDGIGLDCTIGGVEFIGVSYWGDVADKYKPSILAYQPYWEAYQIKTTDDGCCGPFSFDVTVYFDHAGFLFDVAEFDANMEIQIATQFSFSMGIDIEVDSGFTLWSLGFTVT